MPEIKLLTVKDFAKERLVTSSESMQKTLDLFIDSVNNCNMQKITDLKILLKSQMKVVDWFHMELDAVHCEEIKIKARNKNVQVDGEQ